MHKQWLRLFLVLTAIHIILTFGFFTLLQLEIGALFFIVSILAPVSLFSSFGLPVEGVCEQLCHMKPITKLGYTLIPIFWLVIHASIAWFICKMKSFSKGYNNE